MTLVEFEKELKSFIKAHPEWANKPLVSNRGLLHFSDMKLTPAQWINEKKGTFSAGNHIPIDKADMVDVFFA